MGAGVQYCGQRAGHSPCNPDSNAQGSEIKLQSRLASGTPLHVGNVGALVGAFVGAVGAVGANVGPGVGAGVGAPAAYVGLGVGAVGMDVGLRVQNSGQCPGQM